MAKTAEETLASIHTNLYNCVGEAVGTVIHLEKTWSQGELTKRIVRYIYNSAKAPELLELPWREAAKKLVAHAMHGYCTACQEKPWFFEIDLAPAFSSVAWEIISSKGTPKVRFADLEELVVAEYEEILDRTLLMKAMWDATHVTFQDSTVRSKVYKALFNAYQPALDECIVDKRPLDDLQRVEFFTKKWLEDSMRRAWCAVENKETVITKRSVTSLFQNLVAPFGDNHPFSCIPVTLTDSIGRPPRDWNYIRTAVDQLFLNWNQEGSYASSRSSTVRKRKTRESGAPEEEADKEPVKPGLQAPQATRRRQSKGESQEKPEDALADLTGADGHPDCTSAEDCIGVPTDRLVRHILHGEQGDIYCEACWESFLDTNPELEGVFEDGSEAGKPFGGR